jgi:hypothetical protein
MLIAMLCLYQAGSVLAYNDEDSNKLFDFAEDNYPQYFSPANAQTRTGTAFSAAFYYRYYPETGVYLGTRGNLVYVYGGAFGKVLKKLGVISDFVELSASDITAATLETRLHECSYYAGDYTATGFDIKRNREFAGTLSITVENDECVFISNSIPNHDFNDASASMATNVSAITAVYRVTTSPVFAQTTTPLSLQYDNAILLNGVKVDLLAAGCYGVGDGNIGCNNVNQAWRYDPLGVSHRFGADAHNAHTQPDGTYHYHGNPQALFSDIPTSESPVIGFAADGFPIYGPWILDAEQGPAGDLRKAESSYRLKSGERPAGAGNPGGQYDGSFIDDYEYVEGSGDLDECNGMVRDGKYGYYVTDAYPYIIKCFRGTPNASFMKGASL